MSLGGPEPFPVVMLTWGTLLDNRYRIGSPLGQGGMAAVYRAHDEILDREVAVKVLRSEYAADEDVSRRFRKEARHAASLAHPSIAQVFDTGVHDGQQYIVMQLVDGPDLEAVLAERGRLPLEEAVRIVADVADGLQAAHDRGIVHRDVKPGNILLTPDGDARIVDFGIDRAVADAAITSPGLVSGSLPYRSPEQLLGDPVGPATDVYSLGIVFYELITGRRPFDPGSPASVVLGRVGEHPSPPSQILPAIPAAVDKLVLQALERDPEDRFPSARAMAEAIRGWWLVEGQERERDRRTGIPPEALRAASQGAAAAAAGHVVGAPDTAWEPEALPALSGPPMTWTPHVVVAEGRPAPRGNPERRRRSSVPLVFIPIAAFLFVAAAFWTVSNRLQGEGGVLAATASPAPSGVAALPSQSTAAPTQAATSSGAPTAAPSPSPTLPPTPAPTVPPTPKATPQPTAPPVAVPPTSFDSPAAVVARFYQLVAAHDFDAAAALWTPRMRREYPPDGYIDGRFGPTTRIDLRRDEVVALDERAGTAVVAVDLTEYRTVEPSPRRFVGRWDLVLTDDGWRMDEPHF